MIWPQFAMLSRTPRGVPPGSGWISFRSLAGTAIWSISFSRLCRTAGTTSTAGRWKAECAFRSRFSKPCETPLRTAGPGTLPLTLELRSGRHNSTFAPNPVACGICSFEQAHSPAGRAQRRNPMPTSFEDRTEQRTVAGNWSPRAFRRHYGARRGSRRRDV